ncbi:oligosaccharide flippase family protein [Myxococcaceae bacterium JPH2]|nr:oligosaccharide flippase family protein [Myxococcaceae bacterium JPH2]
MDALAQPVPERAPRRSLLASARPLILARLLTAGLTFCIPLALARILDLGGYGTYKQALLIAQTLYYVLPFGVAQGLYFFLPRTERPRPYLGQTLLYLACAGGVAALLLALFLAPLASAFSNPGLLAHRVPLSLYVLGVLGAFPLEASLTARGRTGSAAIAYLASDAVRTAAMLVPIALGLGLGGLVWGLAGFALARMAVAWALFVVLGGDGPLLDGAAFRAQLRYALPFGLSVLLTMVAQYGHQFAVSAAVTPEAFAFYAVACFQLPLVDLLYTPVSEVLMVRLGELERTGHVDEAAAAFRDTVARLATWFFPLAMLLFACAPEFITVLFGARFLPAVPLFRLTVLGTGLSCLPVDAVLRGLNHNPALLRAALLKALVALGLLIPGLWALGVTGALASVALTEVFGASWLLWQVRRALRVSEWGALLPGDALLRRAVASVGAALPCLGAHVALGPRLAALPSGWLWRVLPLGAGGLLFTAAYLALLGRLGVTVREVLGGASPAGGGT